MSGNDQLFEFDVLDRMFAEIKGIGDEVQTFCF